MGHPGKKLARRGHLAFHSFEVHPHQPEAVGGAQVPFEVVPGTPMDESEDGDTVLNGLMYDFQVVPDRLYAHLAVVGANAGFSDDDRLPEPPVEPAQDDAQPFGR